MHPLQWSLLQPPLRSSKDHFDAVKDEVMKLKQAGVIKEVFYPEWLANTVVVKKKNGKWRVCVDFTDLNKTCPKDSFPNALDRLTSGCHYRSSSDELFGRFSRLPPDTFGFGWSREDSFCYFYWELPLQGDALWFKECRGYLLKDDDQDVWTIVRKKTLRSI